MAGKPRVEVGEPLAVDIRLEDTADLVDLLGVLRRTQEAEPLHLADVLVDLVDEAGLVARSRQEDAEHLGDLVAGEHQPRITALGVELGELLPQQREQQADVEGQRAARDQPGHRLGFALVGRPLAEECVPLGLVDDHLQAEHLDVIPDTRLQLEQVLPGALVGVAVDDALHQRDDGGRQVRLGHGVLR